MLSIQYLKRPLIFIPILLIVGCAERAANIEPSYISSEKYGTWNCTSLIKEKSFVDNSLPQASASQDAAADNDALMVFLIGVPTSGGGIKSEVARLKGEQEALRRAIRDENCDSTQRDTRTTSTNNGNNGDVKEKLRALQALKSSGHITGEEYDNMLKNIIH